MNCKTDISFRRLKRLPNVGCFVLWIVFVLCPASSDAAEGEVEQPPGGITNEVLLATNGTDASSTNAAAKYWNVHWEDGLYYQWIRSFTIGGTNRFFKKQTEERVGLSGKLGGLLQADGAVYFPRTSTAEFQNGAQLRRAQIYAAGEFLLNRPVHYKIKFGYYNPDFVLYNFSFWLEDIPWVETVKLGYFKVPMTLAGYGKSTDTLMMEAASPVEAFYPTRRTGLQIGGPTPSKRMTWNAGVFSVGQQVDAGDASQSPLRMIGRFTGLLWDVNEEGKIPAFLHLGASANYTFSGEGNIQYRSRPESHLAPYVVDTGVIDSRNAILFGSELAWVQGPLSVQGEAIVSHVRTSQGESPNFYGFYGDCSWFLTGESRPYDRNTGLFRPVTPLRNLTFDGNGLGAFEFVGHVSFVNLSSKSVDGGEMFMAGGGLNWYFNPVVRMQFNYLFSDVVGGATPGITRLFQSRLQISF